MKILFLSHNFYPVIGGIEVISELLADAFVEAGHEVHLLTWAPDSSEKQFKYKVSRNPGLLNLFKAHAWADVVFENNICLRLSWPAIFFNRTSVIALHTWIARITGKRGLQDRIKYLWLKRSTKVIAVSKALRSASWSDATIVGNPYRALEFKVMPDVDRNKAFVFLGRLVSDKGVDLAILALHKFKQQYESKLPTQEDFSLTIIGDGPELGNLKRMVTDLNLSKEVTFLGSLTGNDLVLVLNAHKILLVPSRWQEPFGVVVLEGLACGCIPIVSDGGGLSEAVGDAGLTFRTGDVDDLVAKMLLLTQDTELKNELIAKSALHLSNFHPDRVTSQYLEAIENSNN